MNYTLADGGGGGSNYSEYESFRSPFESSDVYWTFITLYALVATACIVGNTLVIYVILRHRKMRNVTNFLLANLAVADLGVGVFCVMPTLNLFIQQHWLIGKIMCKLCFFVQSVSYTASVLILTVISIERYIAIIHPMLSRRTSSCALHTVLVVCIWSVAIIYSTPIGLAYDLVTLQYDGQSIQYCLLKTDLKLKLYVIVNFILWYAAPLSLMIVMYSCISVVLWRTSSSSRYCSDRINRADQNIRLTRKLTVANNTLTTTASPQYKDVEMTRVNYPGTVTPLVGVTPQGRKAPGNSNGLNHKHRTDTKPPTKALFPMITVPVPASRPLSNVTQTNQSRRVVICNKGSTLFTKSEDRNKRNNPLMARRKVVRTINVIRLLITIIVSFAVCVLPQHLRLLIQIWGPTNEHYHPIQVYLPPVTSLVFYLNNALNPFLYAFFSNNFRRSMSSLFKLPRCHSYRCHDNHNNRVFRYNNDTRVRYR